MIFKNISKNYISGITISLISIPIAISLAIASQASPIAGIITAIWAGLIASIFGGSNYNIIGPTGALSGIIAFYALEFGIESISILAIIAGFFILGAYLLRLEKFLIFIPSSVIHGFILGVAFIICINQINFALELNLPKYENLFKNFFESLTNLHNASIYSFIIFLIFFISLILIRKSIPKIPGIILISPIAIFIGYISNLSFFPFKLETLGSKFGQITPKLFIFPQIFFDINFIVPAMLIAIIAILETMLSAKIADVLTSTRHNQRKEMLGLGLANIVSGLMGGFPATAALARTALNIKTGATNKISATISSIFIIIWSFLFIKFFSFIPMTIIAAILIYVAINMIEREHFERLWKHDKVNFGISIIVAIATLYKDPIMGILLGTGLSLLLFVEKISHAYYGTSDIEKKELILDEEKIKKILKNENAIVYVIKGKLVYINGSAHVIRIETEFEKYDYIILSFAEVYFIDIDGVDAFDEIVDITIRRNQKLEVIKIMPHIKQFLRDTSKHFRKLEKQGFVLNNINE